MSTKGGAGTQGYAYFSSSHGQPEDGTIMLVNSYKDPTSITLAHELGHAFNVYHKFEGDANGTVCPPNATCGTQGDRVCDTPPHIRSASDCNLAGTNSCDGNSSNTLFKNNYMDYSGDACQNMFTGGQNTRIQAALTVDRASFLAVNGNLALVPPAAPQLDMAASRTLLCGTGQSVQLFDRSLCIPNTYLTNPGLPSISFAWTITNGLNTYNSTAQNPVLTLGSTGVYNVTLSITTGLGTFNRTENGLFEITVGPVSTYLVFFLTDSEAIAKYLRRAVMMRRNPYRDKESLNLRDLFSRIISVKIRAPSGHPLFNNPRQLRALAEASLYHIAFGYGVSIIPIQSWERSFYSLETRKKEVVQFPLRTYNSELVAYYQLALGAESLILSYLALYKILEYFFTSAAEHVLFARVKEQLVAPDFSHLKTGKLRELTKTIRRFDQKMDERKMLQTVLEQYLKGVMDLHLISLRIEPFTVHPNETESFVLLVPQLTSTLANQRLDSIISRQTEWGKRLNSGLFNFRKSGQ